MSDLNSAPFSLPDRVSHTDWHGRFISLYTTTTQSHFYIISEVHFSESCASPHEIELDCMMPGMGMSGVRALGHMPSWLGCILSGGLQGRG